MTYDNILGFDYLLLWSFRWLSLALSRPYPTYLMFFDIIIYIRIVQKSSFQVFESLNPECFPMLIFFRKFTRGCSSNALFSRRSLLLEFHLQPKFWKPNSTFSSNPTILEDVHWNLLFLALNFFPVISLWSSVYQ